MFTSEESTRARTPNPSPLISDEKNLRILMQLMLLEFHWDSLHLLSQCPLLETGQE